jgi:hypothetical protein
VRLATVSLVALLLIVFSFLVLLSLHLGAGVDRAVGSPQLVEATTTATLAVPSPGESPTAQPTKAPNSGGGSGTRPTATPKSGGGGGAGGPKPTATAAPKATATPRSRPTATDTPIPAPTDTPAPTATPDIKTIKGPATLTSCGSGCNIPGLGIAGTHGESGSFNTSGRSVTLQGPARLVDGCGGTSCNGYTGNVTLRGRDRGSGQTLNCSGFVRIPKGGSTQLWCTWNLSSPSFVATGNWVGTCSAGCLVFSNPSPLTQHVVRFETGSDCTRAKNTLRSRGTSWANGFISGAQNGRTLAGKSISFRSESCSPGPGASASSFTARNTTVASAFAYFPGDAQVWARQQLDALLPPGYTWQSTTSCTPSTQSWSSNKATLKCQDTGVAVRSGTAAGARPLGVFMSASSTTIGPNAWRDTLRLLDGLLALVVLLLLAPVVLMLTRLGELGRLELRPWALPALIAGSLAIGTLASLVLGRIERLALALAGILALTLAMIGLIALGLTLGSRGVATGLTGPTLQLQGHARDLGGVVVLSWLVLLLTGVPLLVLLARQIWLAAALAVGALAVGLTDLDPLALRVAVGWTLVAALALMGLAALRAKIEQAERLGLARHGPVLRQELRAIVVPALLFGVLATMVTLSVQPLAAFAEGLQRVLALQPASTRLLVQDPTARSVLLPSSTLDTAAPPPTEDAVTARTPVLSYQLLDGPEAWFNPDPVSAGAPPFLIRAFTQFDGRTWRVGSTTAILPAAPAPASSALTPLWHLQVTLAEQPRAFGDAAVPLPVYGQTYRISLAGARVQSSDGQHPEGYSGWQAPAPVPAGTSYELHGLGLAAVHAGTGTLDPKLGAALTQLPDGLAAELQPTALQLIGNVHGDVARAHALLDGMARAYVYDRSARLPAGVRDPLTWFLDGKRGDVEAWTNAYVALGRAAGLPLRVAVGYLAGAWDEEKQAWVVRHQDATVWAQLALPGLGYQDEFPVAPKVLIELPTLVPLHNQNLTPTPAPSDEGGASSSPPAAPPALPDVVATLRTAGTFLLLLLLLLALGVFLVSRLRWWRWLLALPPSVRPLGQMVLRAQAADIGLSAAETPREASTRIAEATGLGADGHQVLHRLGEAYTAYRYGGVRLDRGLTRTAWRLVRRPLLRLAARRRFGRRRSL